MTNDDEKSNIAQEIKRFKQNEERLWDLAAMTAAPTIMQLFAKKLTLDQVAKLSYDLADSLMKERKNRLKGR